MPQTIPFSGNGERDEFDTELAGIRVRLVARWNPRAENTDKDGTPTGGAWFLDILTDKAPLIYGVRIACGIPLARQLRHPLTRQGMLLAVDTSGRYVDPGRYDLGQRVQVLHFTDDEVLGAQAELTRR